MYKSLFDGELISDFIKCAMWVVYATELFSFFGDDKVYSNYYYYTAELGQDHKNEELVYKILWKFHCA